MQSKIAFQSYSMLQIMFQAVFHCHVPLNNPVKQIVKVSDPDRHH